MKMSEPNQQLGPKRESRNILMPMTTHHSKGVVLQVGAEILQKFHSLMNVQRSVVTQQDLFENNVIGLNDTCE